MLQRRCLRRASQLYIWHSLTQFTFDDLLGLSNLDTSVFRQFPFWGERATHRVPGRGLWIYLNHPVIWHARMTIWSNGRSLRHSQTAP